MAEPGSTEPWQLIVHPAMTEGLVAFLRGRGFDFTRWPNKDDDLPTWLVTPSQELVQQSASSPSPDTATAGEPRHTEGNH